MGDLLALVVYGSIQAGECFGYLLQQESIEKAIRNNIVDDTDAICVVKISLSGIF
jgi:hypothetical protein